jgi:hypothetical protein
MAVEKTRGQLMSEFLKNGKGGSHNVLVSFLKKQMQRKRSETGSLNGWLWLTRDLQAVG